MEKNPQKSSLMVLWVKINELYFQVTGYGENGTGDANDMWRLEKVGGREGEVVNTVTTKLKFHHYFVKCVLHQAAAEVGLRAGRGVVQPHGAGPARALERGGQPLQQAAELLGAGPGALLPLALPGVSPGHAAGQLRPQTQGGGADQQTLGVAHQPAGQWFSGTDSML